jgi:opacity protein-like surface antigen
MPKFYLLFLLTITNLSLSAQDDLLSLLGDDNAEEIEYADASFKTNRIINLHSLVNTAKGVLDFKISHRFGTLNGGPYELFGLDQAYMRIGFDYGINNKLTIGIGRSNFEKTYDGFVKYKFLRQSKGKKNMPISAGLFLGTSLKTIKWANPERENYFTSRLYYTTQLFIGRKFNDAFSLQLSPSLVHRNIVATKAEKNDVFALGIGGRYKVSRRIAINAEYVYLLPDQVATDIYNSLSLGVDIETGGHVFQLHLTNSTSMVESGFITETTNDWLDGGIHFGFNVSRVFTVSREEE